MPTIPHQPAKLSVVGFVILLISIYLQQLDSAHAWQSLVPSDTSSPRATLQSFIDACNEASVKIQGDHHFKRDSAENRAIVRRIIDCIDDTAIPEFERRSRSAEVAVCIKEVLDRVELPLFSEIPDADEIESSEEDLDRWQIPGTRLTIARIADGPRKHEYLFSAGTVERAPEYYQEMKQVPYRTTGPTTSPGFYEWYMTAPSGPMIGRIVDWLPPGAKTRAGGLAYWQWIGLVLALALTVVLFVINFRLQRHYSLRFRDDRPYLYCLTIIFPLFAMLIPYWFQHVADEYVSLRGKWLYSATFGANIVALIASVWLVFSAVNRVVAVILASPRINPKGLDAQFIRIVSKILSLAISVLVFIEVGHYLGIPITTLLASAGVGGLAVALYL